MDGRDPVPDPHHGAHPSQPRSTEPRLNSSNKAPWKRPRCPSCTVTSCLVFVDRLDLATARAIQYARSLNPDEVRAVHFLLDNRRCAGFSGKTGDVS